MNSSDFMLCFFDVEDHLFEMLPDFDRSRGFASLLDELRTRGIVTDEFISELRVLWRTRNQVVSSPSPITVDGGHLGHVTQKLGLLA